MEEVGRPLYQSPADLYAPLLRAILEDDWKAAEAFIQDHPNYCLGAPITKEEGTALHFAAAAKSIRSVKELVKLMQPEELELKTNRNCTALYFAAQSKFVTTAEEMVKKNKYLPLIPMDDIEALPLYAAIKTRNRNMVSYLYSVTRPYIEDLDFMVRIELLHATIYADMYDIALKILDALKLAPHEVKEYLWFSFKLLAKKPSKIGNKSQPSVWERCLNSGFRGRFCNKAMMQASAHQLVECLWKELRNFPTLVNSTKILMLLFVEAAEVGNVEFLIILIRSYPHLIWMLDGELYANLLHVAIKHRQEGVFNLIYEIGVLTGNFESFYANEKHDMLDKVAELPSEDRLNVVSGAALQMQRELLWFQELQKIVPKSPPVSISLGPERKGDSPVPSLTWNKFMENHKELKNHGEKWMTVTANSCMLVAALIATVVFPAAFTVPGGNNQETGIPIFLEGNLFTVFFVSDAIAMLFSSFSILIFLSMLTSRYTEKDFLVSLPRRLALGLTTLLISIVGMLIAFSAACFLVFKSKIRVPIGIIVAAPVVPISLFFILHHSLWFDIFRSAFYSKSFLFRSQNRLFK